MDTLQAVIILIVAAAGLVSAGALIMRQNNKAVDGERSAREALLEEVRSDLKTETESASALRHRVKELEDDKQRRDLREDQYDKDLKAALTALGDLQKWRKEAQAAIESKDRTISGLRDTVKRVERDCSDKERTIVRQKTIIDTQAKTLQFFGAEYAKTKADPAPVTGAAGKQAEITQEG